MHRSSSFVIVTAEQLSRSPVAFKRYVDEHFQAVNFEGKECFVAIRATSVQLCDGSGRRGQTKGVAPSHSVDISQYTEGLPEGQSLNGWIRMASELGLLLQFAASWNDGCVSPMLED